MMYLPINNGYILYLVSKIYFFTGSTSLDIQACKKLFGTVVGSRGDGPYYTG